MFGQLSHRVVILAAALALTACAPAFAGPVERPQEWAGALAQAVMQGRADRVTSMLSDAVTAVDREKIKGLADKILSDTRRLGEPEIIDTLKVDKLGSSIVVCRYYLAYSAGEYFLKVSLHKHLRGWALNAIAYSQNATDIMNGY